MAVGSQVSQHAPGTRAAAVPGAQFNPWQVTRLHRSTGGGGVVIIGPDSGNRAYKWNDHYADAQEPTKRVL